MITWSVEDALKALPCREYTPEVLERLCDGRERLSVADVAALDIPVADRVWALLRMIPSGRWMPLVFAAADRAFRIHAANALRAIGLEEHALTLETLIVDYDSALDTAKVVMTVNSIARLARLARAQTAGRSAAEAAYAASDSVRDADRAADAPPARAVHYAYASIAAAAAAAESTYDASEATNARARAADAAVVAASYAAAAATYAKSLGISSGCCCAVWAKFLSSLVECA